MTTPSKHTLEARMSWAMLAADGRCASGYGAILAREVAQLARVCVFDVNETHSWT